MQTPRAALLVLVCAASAALSPLFGARVPVPVAPDLPRAESVRRVHYEAATPLEQIPLYSLDASSPMALRSLGAEIDRLYRHATTLPSGHERRVFETRIHQLEKQLRPLLLRFDASAWEELRLAVRSEWLDVQAALPGLREPAEIAPPSAAS